MIRGVLRQTLLRLDPERAHNIAIASMAALSRLPVGGLLEGRALVTDPRLAQQLFGLSFRNPVGLAAGFDKQASAVPAWSYLGFGFCEIGTVTAEPQPGNDKPRMFRLKEDRAVINRLGFNSRGAEHVATRLRNWESAGKAHRIPLGVNIGKTKTAADAAADYLASFRHLVRYADYIAINVSSPNTPGLRDLQERGALEELLGRISSANRAFGRRVPLLVKIAPDLDDAGLDDLHRVVLDTKLDGVVATNTTLARTNLATDARALEAIGAGGLSGAPLRARALEVVRKTRAALPGVAIIGVGGVETGAHAKAMLDAGADLVQLYTGFIYRGPWAARAIARELARLS